MNRNTDIQLFNRMFTDYRDRFYRFAFSYLYDREAAEDVVAESLIYYWENRQRLEEVKDVPLYILVTIKNKCLDYLIRKRTWEHIAENLLSNEEWELQTRISSLEACEPDLLLSKEIQSLARQALNKLPEKSRKIFLMNRYEGKSYQTIATEMNLSVKSVEFHISKALKVLRVELKDYFPYVLFFFFPYN